GVPVFLANEVAPDGRRDDVGQGREVNVRRFARVEQIAGGDGRVVTARRKTMIHMRTLSMRIAAQSHWRYAQEPCSAVQLTQPFSIDFRRRGVVITPR